MDPARHAPHCELAVLLLCGKYDQASRPLADALRSLEKPFVVWPSPVLENAGELDQRGFVKYLEGLESSRKTLLAAFITLEKLKEEVFARLNPRAKLPHPSEASRAFTWSTTIAGRARRITRAKSFSITGTSSISNTAKTRGSTVTT